MSKLEEMQISVENLKKQVDETLLFADDIKKAIKSNGVELSDDAPVSEYAGKIEGLFDAGKKAEYDALWDNLQNYGTRQWYRYAFISEWNNNNFFPKYDLVPKQYSYGMFWGNRVTNLAKRLEECGVILDTSGVDDFGTFFSNSLSVRLPTTSTVSASYLNNIFQNSYAETIDKLILKNDGSQTFSTSMFASCSLLKNIVIEGIIGQNGFNISWSKLLTKESITSIINALSSITAGLTVTISLTAVNTAFSSEEWETLAATKSNWTISLIDS